MAGTINADTLKADSNLKLQIASANVAFIDANGLTIVGNSLNVGGGRIVVTSNNSISTPTVIGANLVTATGTTALGITANGQITTANAPFILTGGQLQFPATQIASGDANCLDDYEEGTFTPTIFGGTSAGTTTYASQTGYYTKIGRMVVFIVDVEWTGQTGTGTLTLGNLPFTCGSNYGQNSYSSTNLALSASYFSSLAQVNINATTVNFYQGPVGGGTLATVGIDTSARIWMTGIYFV
jgi:hypothetical protein